MKKTTAYCFANGVIKFTTGKVPEGALDIGAGPAKQVHRIIDMIARESYPSKRGGSDTVPLVPGIPEGKDQKEKCDALLRFVDQFKKRQLWETNPIIQDMDTFENRGAAPEGITMAIFRNDLATAIGYVRQRLCTPEQLQAAVFHKASRIDGVTIQRALKQYKYVK